MAPSEISGVSISAPDGSFGPGERITLSVKFSIRGGIRDAFNEEAWTAAYNKNDNVFKLKYGIKVFAQGIRRRTLGSETESYRKASIFWTRNPKLVNPMKEKRVWVQVAKNFEPFVRLTEDETRGELFDFDESVSFDASELGEGTHRIGGEIRASWQKHHYTEPESIKAESDGIEITVG